MTTVPRQAIDAEWAQKMLTEIDKGVDDFIVHIETDPGSLHTLSQWTLMSFLYRTVLDPTAAEQSTWSMLRLAAQAASGVFAAAMADEGEVDHDVNGPVRLPATGPTSRANAGAWLDAAWLAIILRDNDMIQQLCAVPLDLLRASGVEHEAYMYPWVETIQAALRREPIPPSMFMPAMDGTDPDNARFMPAEEMLLLVFPPIHLFSFLLRRNEERFNEALEQALRSHAEFWSTEDRANDAQGFVALAPLAIAVLATRAGMTVTVDSEYMPANLLRSRAPEAS
jgi:Immunity protein 49